MPPPLLPQGTLDYTGIVRLDMLARLQSLYNQANPEWDDFSPAFPENLLLEGMVFIADIIRGTMEERVRQLNWATVTDRLAAIRLGRQGDFTLSGAASATLTGTFSTANNSPANVAIPIPEGTVVLTGAADNPVKYRVTDTDVEIPVGQSSITSVNLEQAESISDTFSSTDEPNQVLILESSPYIDDSAVITATNGSYTLYKSFLGVSSTTKAAVVLVDDAGVARVIFGTGINGAIPQGTITVQYKIGGGVAGEVEANAEWSIQDTIVDALGTPVAVNFSNSASSQPGVDAMSVDEARVRGPLSLRTINRLVIEEDFEYVATSVPGIARALMATSNVAASIAEDTGRLEVVAVGTRLTSGRFEPATPTDAKLDEIRALVVADGDYPPVMGFSFAVVAATLREVDVSVRIHKASNVDEATVAADIRAALDDFFAVSLSDGTPNTTIDFGAKLLGSDGLPDYLITWSSIFTTIADVEGVRYISAQANNLLLNGLHGSVSLQPREFPKLGTVTIFDEDQGGKQI